MEISSNKISTNVVQIIYGCLNLYLWSKFPQIKPKLWKFTRNLLGKQVPGILMWKLPQSIWFFGNYNHSVFANHSTILEKFRAPNIWLWKDLNFSHVCDSLPMRVLPFLWLKYFYENLKKKLSKELEEQSSNGQNFN